MATPTEELHALMARLPTQEQERVLSFARELPAHPSVFPHTPLQPGSPPEALLHIRVDAEVGEAMEQALADYERVWPDE